MKASGATEYHFCFLLFGWPNGSSAPATTRFDGSTACTASATALTIAAVRARADRVQVEC